MISLILVEAMKATSADAEQARIIGGKQEVVPCSPRTGGGQRPSHPFETRRVRIAGFPSGGDSDRIRVPLIARRPARPSPEIA